MRGHFATLLLNGLRDYGVEGQIGLEKTPEQYVRHLVRVFRELRRVLRPDGTFWLNIADSYNAGGGHTKNGPGSQRKNRANLEAQNRPAQNITGFKPKDRVGIPHRLVFALQADGWYWRDEIIWYAPNKMPESVTDRCTKAHEFIFLLTKSPRYFFDNHAIRERATPELIATCQRKLKKLNGRRGDVVQYKQNQATQTTATETSSASPNLAWGDPEKLMRLMTGSNKRSVWTIPTQPNSDLKETCHLARVREGVLSGDMKYRASTNCELHEYCRHPVSSAFYGEPGADNTSRTSDNDTYRASAPVSDCEPIERSPVAGKPGYTPGESSHEYTETGIFHSKKNRKRDRALSTNLPCTLSEETGDGRQHKSTQPVLSVIPQGISVSSILKGDSFDGALREIVYSIAGISKIPKVLRGVPLDHLRKKGCRCRFYTEITETTSHFAAYPRKLVLPCILAGTSEKGCCPECGAPWKRILEKKREATRPARESKVYITPPLAADSPYQKHNGDICGNRDPERHVTASKTIGWKPTCDCGHENTIPCTVLDPFGGTGTTAAVALSHNRRAITIELNPEYVGFIEAKIKKAIDKKGFGL